VERAEAGCDTVRELRISGGRAEYIALWLDEPSFQGASGDLPLMQRLRRVGQHPLGGVKVRHVAYFAAPTNTNAIKHAVALVLRHACRVPFCTTQSPGFRFTFAPSSSSKVISPEITTP
jgi:hypothetical protein